MVCDALGLPILLLHLGLAHLTHGAAVTASFSYWLAFAATCSKLPRSGLCILRFALRFQLQATKQAVFTAATIILGGVSGTAASVVAKYQYRFRETFGIMRCLRLQQIYAGRRKPDYRAVQI